MIQINEKFSCHRDKYQWILVETYCGKTKDGSPKNQTRETYHPKLDQVLAYVIERSCGDCESLDEIRDLLKSAPDILKQHCCCGNPEQCWEPCGDLGKSEEHARVVDVSEVFPS